MNSVTTKGQPRKLCDGDVQRVKKIAMDKKCGAKSIASALRSENGPAVSTSTITRALAACGGRYAVCPRKLHLTEQQMQKRLKFCRDYRRKSFRGIFFTDSTYITMCTTKASPRQTIWLFKGERHKEVVKQKAEKLHIYAGCSYFGKSQLHFATGTSGQKSKYINPKTKQPMRGVCAAEYQDICRRSLIPNAEHIFGQAARYCHNFTFQQDGARPHQAQSTLKMFQVEFNGKGVKLMNDWPPSSPDLSPIENAWAELKRLVREKGPIRSVAELKRAVSEAWDSIPNDFFENAMKGMRKRLEDCIKAKGGRF